MFFKGFTLGLSLIVAIGGQNAHVLRQGMRNEHAFLVGTICFISDALLISLGISGVGVIISKLQWLTDYLSIGAALILLYYGVEHFISAYKGKKELLSNGEGIQNKTSVIGKTLSLTFLNPHVYLDTVILLGSASALYNTSGKVMFGAGAIFASFLWFYSLALIPRAIGRRVQKESFWRVIDFSIGIILFFLAYKFIVSIIK